jgi:ectoine hydroxylase-related dioxygenase (phytanoyl-CoA dioxygenase family)
MTTDDDVRFYRESGYLLCRAIYDDAEVDELRAAVDDVLAAVAGSEHDKNHAWGGSQGVLKGYHDVQYHHAAFARALAHPRMVEVLTRLIGPNVQLHHTKMLVKPPEQGAPFPMHQDYPYFPHTRHSVVAASIHLDDADLENGCLRVVPGSHALGPLPAHGPSHIVDADEFPLERGTPVPARAGDVLFFSYLTVHGSGVNGSGRTRRNVLFQYRDPADAPVLSDGRERHVDWGQGLMVAGHNADYWLRRPRFVLEAAG